MGFRVQHLFHITVIGGDQQMASDLLDGGDNSAQAGIDGFNCLD